MASPADWKRIARICRILLFVVIGVTLGGTLLGLLRSVIALHASGLSAADKQRILASGIAEAFYNTVFAAGLILVCLLLALWARRRAR